MVDTFPLLCPLITLAGAAFPGSGSVSSDVNHYESLNPVEETKNKGYIVIECGCGITNSVECRVDPAYRNSSLPLPPRAGRSNVLLWAINHFSVRETLSRQPGHQDGPVASEYHYDPSLQGNEAEAQGDN